MSDANDIFSTVITLLTFLCDNRKLLLFHHLHVVLLASLRAEPVLQRDGFPSAQYCSAAVPHRSRQPFNCQQVNATVAAAVGIAEPHDRRVTVRFSLARGFMKDELGTKVNATQGAVVQGDISANEVIAEKLTTGHWDAGPRTENISMCHCS